MNCAVSFSAPIGISARHVHLSSEHLQLLFGSNLTVDRPLNQKGEFAAVERLTVATATGSIHNVRVLGPVRKQTQVEISKSDAFSLGLKTPVRLSGNLSGSAALTLIGPRGSISIPEGAIVASRHLHIPPMEANRFGLKQNQIVEAVAGKERQCVFRNVVVRIISTAALELHLDTDEANAANVKTGDLAQINVIQLPQSINENDSQKYICVEDVQNLIRNGFRLNLSKGKKITPAARELAKSRGILDEYID